jgi:hypothetical protein
MSKALKLFCAICGNEFLSPVDTIGMIDKTTEFQVASLFCSESCEKKFNDLLAKQE